MKTTRCKSCGAEIFFAKTKAGKFIPCDYDITESDGNDILYVDDIVGFKKLPVGRKGYLSHFATCPEAKKFRRIT